MELVRKKQQVRTGSGHLVDPRSNYNNMFLHPDLIHTVKYMASINANTATSDVFQDKDAGGTAKDAKGIQELLDTETDNFGTTDPSKSDPDPFSDIIDISTKVGKAKEKTNGAAQKLSKQIEYLRDNKGDTMIKMLEHMGTWLEKLYGLPDQKKTYIAYGSLTSNDLYVKAENISTWKDNEWRKAWNKDNHKYEPGGKIPVFTTQDGQELRLITHPYQLLIRMQGVMDTCGEAKGSSLLCIYDALFAGRTDYELTFMKEKLSRLR